MTQRRRTLWGWLSNRSGKETETNVAEQVAYEWMVQLPSQPTSIQGTGKIDRVRGAVKTERMRLGRAE